MLNNRALGLLFIALTSLPAFAQESKSRGESGDAEEAAKPQQRHIPPGTGHSVNSTPTDADMDAEFDKFAVEHCDWPELSTHNAYQRKSEYQKSLQTPEEKRADEVQRTNVHRVLKKLNSLSIAGTNIRSIEVKNESRPLDETGELVIAATATDAEIEKMIKDSVAAAPKQASPPPDEEKLEFLPAQRQRDPRAARLVVRLCKVRAKLGIRLSLRPWDGDDITLKEASDLVQMLEGLEASGKKFNEGITQVAVMSSPRFAAAKLYSSDKRILLLKRTQRAEDLADFVVAAK